MDWYHSISNALIFGDNEVACGWHILPSEIQPFLTDPTLMASRAFVHMLAYGEVGFAAIGLISWNYIDDGDPNPCPNPLTPDGDMDWIARWVGPYTTQVGAPVQLLNPNIFDNTHLSKARRRLGNDRSLLICYAMDDFIIGAGAFASLSLDLRTLIKE